MSFGKLTVERKTGAEEFHDGPKPLGPTVLDFWQWSASDLISNALRGHVAEFLVARALGATGHIRNEWDSYDLDLPSGLRVEVKSAAYLQTWEQKGNSSITFRIGPTLAWDPASNTLAQEPQRRRQADVYVFALLAHQDKLTLDPLNVAQWEFYVLSAALLDQKCPVQKQIRLESLLRLEARQCSFSTLQDGLTELRIVPRPTVRPNRYSGDGSDIRTMKSAAMPTHDPTPPSDLTDPQFDHHDHPQAPSADDAIPRDSRRFDDTEAGS